MHKLARLFSQKIHGQAVAIAMTAIWGQRNKLKTLQKSLEKIVNFRRVSAVLLSL